MVVPSILGLYSIIVGGIGVLVNSFELIDSQNRNYRIKKYWLILFFLALAFLGLTSLIQLHN